MRSRRFQRLAAIALLACAILAPHIPAARASWLAIEPDVFARRCPVIVTGKIISVDKGVEHDGQLIDVAQLKVGAIHKCLLRDAPVKVGTSLPVRMDTLAKPMRRSTHLRYPVGTDGTWLLVMTDDGGWDITRHPVQHQKAAWRPKAQAPEVMYTREQWLGLRRIQRGPRPPEQRVCYSQAGKRQVRVGKVAALRKAIDQARPGDTILLAGGRYKGPIYLRNVQGTSRAPVVLSGADPDNPPIIVGGNEAIHLVACNYVTLAFLTVQNCRDNGINIDDGGDLDTPSRGILVANCTIRNVGPRGNHDALKLSGLADFHVSRCRIEGWGGSAIDMVGCGNGRISRCDVRGAKGHTQHTGVQMKGGTEKILVERCSFRDAGGRAINLGGSTDTRVYRPHVRRWEARNIVVAGNTFIGSEAPIAYVTARGGLVKYNTILRPGKWVARILQEKPTPQWESVAHGRFTRNLVLFDHQVRRFINIGPNTRPETFRFSENAWIDLSGNRRPDLPVPQAGSVVDIPRPKIELTDRGLEISSDDARLGKHGAEAYTGWEGKWEQP
jgi:hypothetical protein